jgi:hypothetical protein
VLRDEQYIAIVHVTVVDLSMKKCRIGALSFRSASLGVLANEGIKPSRSPLSIQHHPLSTHSLLF